MCVIYQQSSSSQLHCLFGCMVAHGTLQIFMILSVQYIIDQLELPVYLILMAMTLIFIEVIAPHDT